VAPDDTPAHILVVARATADSPALLSALHTRAERGPCWFHVVVPAGHEDARTLTRVLPSLQAAAHRPVGGEVSVRRDPMDAVEESLMADDYDEIILVTRPPGLAGRLHVDLAHRVAHLGLPLTTVTTGAHPTVR
jgi:hypothetical protein